MSLKQPHLKMSKSHADPKSRILITDVADDIRAKIKGSLTDSMAGVSYDPVGRPGVANLLDIMAHCSENDSTPVELAADCEALSMRAFKERVAARVVDTLAPIRERYHEIIDRDGGRFIDDVAARGAAEARAGAEETMERVRVLVGLG